MKKLLSLLTITSLLAAAPIAMADDEITVTIDGNPVEFDVPPQIINDRTMVPMRAIFESLGATVNWDDKTKTAFGYLSGIGVSFTVDDTTMIKNTVSTELDTPAIIIDGRTLLPVRAVAESFGMNVSWDNVGKTVLINSADNLTTLYYSNSDAVWYSGQINTDGNYPSGYGTTWNKDGSIEYTGQFEYGLFYGQGCLYKDSKATYIGTFINGKPTGEGRYYNSDDSIKSFPTTSSKNSINEAYEEELLQIKLEYADRLNEIYATQEELDELINTDPYSTEEAKAILGKYDMSNSSSIKGANGGNVDSYSAANAMRQQAALYSQAQETVLKAYNLKIQNMQNQIDRMQKLADNWYNSAIQDLQRKYGIQY